MNLILQQDTQTLSDGKYAFFSQAQQTIGGVSVSVLTLIGRFDPRQLPGVPSPVCDDSEAILAAITKLLTIST